MFPVFPVLWRGSRVCLPAEGPHHPGENAGLQSRRHGPGVRRRRRPHEHLVAAGESREESSARWTHGICAAEPERTIDSSSCVCVCLSGRLRAPESGRRFRCHPEHCLDPRCGRGRLFQQVKGQAPQHCFFGGGLCRCVLCLTVLRSSPVLCRTCWW